jgi:hypothetical protein
VDELYATRSDAGSVHAETMEVTRAR